MPTLVQTKTFLRDAKKARLSDQHYTKLVQYLSRT